MTFGSGLGERPKPIFELFESVLALGNDARAV
jgi:hypothetical protein